MQNSSVAADRVRSTGPILYQRMRINSQQMVCRRKDVLRRNGRFFDLTRDSIGPSHDLASTDSCSGQD